MEIIEFLASIIGTLILWACALITLWLFLPQFLLAIFSIVGIWIYFQGYPWIGFVVAFVGTLGGSLLGLVITEKILPTDSVQSTLVTDTEPAEK